MNLVVWKNYLEGQILYRSLVPPIKNGVIVNLEFKSSIMSTSIVMVILGVSLSAATIPSVSEMVEIARQEGCAEQASNFIAGLMNSLVFFGEFMGPTLGGMMIMHADGDFALGASYFAIYCLVIVLSCKSNKSVLYYSGVRQIGQLLK